MPQHTRTCPGEAATRVTCNGTRCLFIHTHDELRITLDPNVVGDDDEVSKLPSRRVWKVVDGFAAKRRTWAATDAGVDYTILYWQFLLLRVLELGRVGDNLSQNYISSKYLESFHVYLPLTLRIERPRTQPRRSQKKSVDLITGYDVRAK